MASGYTAGVASGRVTSLRDFTAVCARAFIASMREAPAGTPIPTRLSAWNPYTAEVFEASQSLEMAKSATDAMIEADIDEHQRRRIEAEDSYHKGATVTRARYEAMIAKVTAWDAPEVMREIRQFMLDQLHESMKFDCPPPRPVATIERPTVAAFRADKIAQAEIRLAEARARAKAEDDRTNRMNKWLAEFHAALPTD